MIKEVLERGADGEPTVIVFRETPEETAARLSELKEQAERGRQVAASLGVRS